MLMTREVAYASYVSGWMSKTKPPSKDKFWPIGTKKKTGATDKMKEAMRAAWARYEEEKKQNG